MPNLRIVNINAADSRSIKVKFNVDLSEEINSSNVQIVSEEVGVPDLLISSVSVVENILIIDTYPQTPYARYKVFFRSTPSVTFVSKDGRSFLIEDNRSNCVKIIGSENDWDQIRSALVSYIGGSNSIYDLTRGTNVRNILNAQSKFLGKALSDIRQTKNANYLELTIRDERKTRRFGPWDRLNQEGAFEVVRVGLEPTNEDRDGVISYDSFPRQPITLQREIIVNERLSFGLGNGTYNDLTLSLNRKPVTKVNSIRIEYENGTIFEYDIRYLGYQIKDTKYDPDFSRRFILLEDNQVKLNEDLKDDPNFDLPSGNDVIVISYEYKFLGRVIDPESVNVVEVIQVVREQTPALSVVFSLNNGPVVTSSDKIPEKNGVEFLNPYSETPFRSIHPAFRTEIPYASAGMPARPGEYSINYDTGRVYVYGAETNDGTGYFPPVVNYFHRKSYVPRLDYTYVEEFRDLVASPLRDLERRAAKINFRFEDTLVEGIDYKANVHKESRNERIENRLATLDSFYTLNNPITNVFKIFNETTGEIYSLRRFSDNRVYFDFRNPPRILSSDRERATFNLVLSEPLILESEMVNSSLVRVLKFRLQNQNIIAATEDVIGSSFNTSVTFSQNDVFDTEIYYDSQELTESININRLDVGKYQINYRDGIVYIGVSGSQTLNLGTVSYRRSVISPNNPHVTSVSDIYTSINVNFGKDRQLDYLTFAEGEIVPNPVQIQFSDERYLNEDPLFVDAGTIKVQSDIKFVRGVYDAFDLNNNDLPTNFAEATSFSANIITFDNIGIAKSTTGTLDGSLTVTVPMISPGIIISSVFSVVRTSDYTELLDGNETFLDNTITLNTGNPGDEVIIKYAVIMNGGSTPIVDYNKGDLFVDYQYLADDILVTYEWGDNVIDFRESNILEENDIYYVTYKIGALRNSLLENFGSLVQIPELQVFDEDLDREVYRDILQGALQTFTKGPTIPAMKQLISEVTQIDPRIVEAVIWSLGVSYLNKIETKVLGNPYLTVGCFDQGVKISNPGEGIALPISNNLRLEEGTLETCIIPQWNGIDNDATLTFDIKKDGYNIDPASVFIGASSYHPEIVDGKFSINRLDEKDPSGLPALIFSNTGIFIYYDKDEFKWKMLAKDAPNGTIYSGTIYTSGAFYDVKFIEDLGELTDVLRSGIKTIDFEFRIDNLDLASPDGYSDNVSSIIPGFSFDGIQFMSDDEHYIFDFGKNEHQNRFSLYKDGRGYLVFEVWDKGGFGNLMPERRSVYQVSADIQNWKVGEHHNVAISWILNSVDRKDEMHLYIDGFEVPNISRYGNIPEIASVERFRTVVPEQVVGTISNILITNNNMSTVIGSPTVNSTIDFSSAGILPGDSIEIFEAGFGTYIILAVNTTQLILNSPMPATLSNVRFSINPASFVVGTEIDIYKNIGIFITDGVTETEIPGTRAELPSYSIERNALNQKILKILGNANIGDQILIKTFGLNHRRCREKVYLWNENSILKTGLPPPVNLDDIVVRSVTLPLVVLGPNNSTLNMGNFESTFTELTQPSNDIEGRILEIRVTGGNVNFPVTITINGTSNGGGVEVVNAASPGKVFTTLKWRTISSIEIIATPLNVLEDSVGVEIKERYSVTEPNGNNIFPVVRFSYRTQAGLTLEGDGSDIVSDPLGFFPASEVGNLLEITSPLSVAGLYRIEERIDNTTVRLDSVLGTAFTGGGYESFNISIGRSGFQNGFFFFERAGFTNVPFLLPAGWYEFDYATYLSVIFENLTYETGIIGNDITLQKPVRGVLDEFRILNRQLTDTRIGETLSVNEESITTGAFKISPFRKNKDTLTLLHFEELPPKNDVDFYKFAEKQYIQSGNSVNGRFGHSVVLRDKGIIFDNQGRLNTLDEGMIEFWVSPRFDTYNDPNLRVYFDASANTVEDAVSITKGRVPISGLTQNVQYVRLVSDTNLTGTDYFAGGRIDGNTLVLNQPLPFQNTPVKVAYIPTGVQGDRVVIAKDREGFISFTVTASGKEYQVRQPVFWPRNTWHRIRASFKFNRKDNLDEIRLFIDGEERGSLLFGADGLLFGEGLIWGQAAVGGVGNQVFRSDINFKDRVQFFSLGQDFAGNFGAEARFDNLKISNKAIDPFVISGQPKDVYFDSNVNFMYPSITDAFTTFLFDFDQTIEKTEDFAIIRDAIFGIFNFDIDIIDSFDIVTGDIRVKTVVEALINTLKPAVSKVGIRYIK
jgi:hypothetical protein